MVSSKENLASRLIRFAGKVLLLRLILFDGLGLLPRNPVGWLLSLTLLRMSYILLGEWFAYIAWFYNSDVSPAIAAVTILTVGLLGGIRREVLWPKGKKWARLWTLVVFLISPLTCAVRNYELYTYRNALSNVILTAFGNNSFAKTALDLPYDLVNHVLDVHGSVKVEGKLTPNHTVVFKEVHMNSNAICSNGLYSYLPFNPLRQNSIQLQQGILEVDMYVPPKRADGSLHPLVVYVHGGAWKVGGRGSLVVSYQGAGIPEFLLDQSIAIAAITYRLECTGVNGEEILEDVNDAINYIVEHAVSWGVDPERLVLWGISAGAHLSLTTGYRGLSKHVDGVISFYGPTELREADVFENSRSPLEKIHAYGYTDSTRFLCKQHATKDAVDRCFEKLSPVALVHSAAPPTLLIHGRDDPLVPIWQARNLAQALEKHGVLHALVEIPYASHNCDFYSSTPCAQASRFAIERFLHKVWNL